MNSDSLEKMIAAGKDSALLRLTLARVLFQEEQPDRALQHLDAAVKQDPTYTAAWKELGRVQLHLNHHEAALTAWQQGIDTARVNGDKQAEKEMQVFMKRLLKAKRG